ncbi:hypothetical protein AAC387_Pa05g3220 [Persea americana]
MRLIVTRSSYRANRVAGSLLLARVIYRRFSGERTNERYSIPMRLSHMYDGSVEPPPADRVYVYRVLKSVEHDICKRSAEGGCTAINAESLISAFSCKFARLGVGIYNKIK